MPLVVWALLATGLLGAIGIWNSLAFMLTDFGDVDDALRMVQVRELMSHGRWYDTTLARIGGPEGLLSHWSRLIDLPLALLVGLFGLALSSDQAELMVRIAWPLLLMGLLLYAVARTVELSAGRACGLIALGLLVACPSALIQFSVGRIDHHNAQILGATAATLLLWARGLGFGVERLAAIAAGTAVAIGYEALPIVLVCTAAAAVWGLFDDKAAPGVRTYVLWLAGVLGIAFVSTVAPSRWGDVKCDALSLNLVLLIGAGAVGLGLALRPAHVTARPRMAAWLTAIAGAAIGVVLFAAAQPACLAGPMGQFPGPLRSVWYDHASDTQSLRMLLASTPHAAIASAFTFSAAIAAQIVVLRRYGKGADAFYLSVLIFAVTLASWQIKYLPYASVLAMPPLAIWIGRLRGTQSVSATVQKCIALATLNQYALIVLSIMAVSATIGEAEPSEGAIGTSAQACFRHENLKPLNALSPGLMFSPIDLGSHLLADTHHSVLAAPYHRIGPAILETHAILSARSPQEASARLTRVGATYVMICPGMNQLVTPLDRHPHSFYERLRRGEPLPFLEAVAPARESPLRIWRIVTEEAKRAEVPPTEPQSLRVQR